MDNSPQQNTPSIQPNNPNLIISPQKTPKKKLSVVTTILIIIILIFLFSTFLFASRKLPSTSVFKKELTHSSSVATKTNPFLTETLEQKNTTHVTYIQNHDLWLSTIDKSFQIKIASYTPTTFSHRNYLNGDEIKSSWDDIFIVQPRISGDAKFIVYRKIADNSLKELSDWKNKVATESAEIKTSGNSLAFMPPQPKYNVILYNVLTKSAKIVDAQVYDSEDYYIDLYYWARNTNILPVHTIMKKNSGIAFIYITNNDLKFITLKKLLNTKFNDGPNMSENSFDIPTDPLISPDGTQLIAYYQLLNPAVGCNGWGYKTYYVNLLSKKLNKLLLTPPTICKAENIGWIGDQKFVTLELLPNTKFNISVWSQESSDKKIFMDYEGYPSQTSISPNGKWLTYLREIPKVKKTEYVFFNTSTKEGINLLGVMQEGGKKELGYSEIFTPKWDRNSANAFIKMKRKNDSMYDIVSYNVDKREYKILLENISDFDIN